jgi:diguanylate cyclase (GGDEF)-like protein
MPKALRRPPRITSFPSWIDDLGPLPLLFVLCAVEAQRNWNQPAMWPYLAGSILAAVTWLTAMANRSWTARHTIRVVDAAILLVIGSAAIFLNAGDAENAAALSSSLFFWAPLICLWWGTTLLKHPWLRLAQFALLYGLPLYVGSHQPDAPYFEETLLGALILIVARQFAQRCLATSSACLQDHLTGLVSPEGFEAELAMIAAVADRYRFPFSLIACAPDTVGKHAEQPNSAQAEESLQSMACLISDRIRRSDTACRWEGGLFVILLPNTSGAEAAPLAHNLHAALRGLAEAAAQPWTFSLGVVTHQFGDDAMHTFATVEQALNESVKAGGNRLTLTQSATSLGLSDTCPT